MTDPTRLLTGFQDLIWISSYRVDLKSYQKVVVFPRNNHASTTPVGTSYWDVQYCSIQCPQLDKGTDKFSLPTPETCIEPSGTMNPLDVSEAIYK